MTGRHAWIPIRGHSADAVVTRLRAWRLPAVAPWAALGALVVAQWGAVLVYAFSVRHNGWLFYQGGDQTFFWTDAWALSQGRLPEAAVGWGWPYVLAPVSLAGGANVLAGLPAIVLLNVLVLGPVATLAAYGIGVRLGGRAIGYLSAAVWVAMPYVAVPLFVDRYHEKYVEQFLPQALGLTGMADYPSMVVLLAASYLVFRALDTRGLPDAALAGVLAGFAAAIKPSNLLFLAAPVVAFALARRFRLLVPFAAGLALPLLALYVWKLRGFGSSPVSLLTPAPGIASALLGALGPLDRYLDFSWERIEVNYISLREVFWSTRLLEFALPAGILAVALRSVPKAAFLALWFGVFFVVKGGSDRSTVDSGSFFRFVMPGFPAYLLLVAAIPLLAPPLGRRLAARAPRGLPLGRRPALAGAIVLGLVPLLLVAAVRPIQAGRTVNEFISGVFVPVTGDVSLTAERLPGTRPEGTPYRLTWTPPGGSSADVFYRVFVSPPVATPDPQLPPARDGIRCQPRELTGGDAPRCQLEMAVLHSTHERSLEVVVQPGTWTYRVALAANWLDDEEAGDILLVSRPIQLTG
jgi:hypothetical protein